MNNDIKPLVDDLNTMILQGKILEAFDKYYSDSIVMQENNDAPRVGKDVNRTYEEAFANGVQEFHDGKVVHMAINGNIAMVEWFMDFTHKDWGRAARSQVSVQIWENGKIVSERFYYGK